VSGGISNAKFVPFHADLPSIPIRVGAADDLAISVKSEVDRIIAGQRHRMTVEVRNPGDSVVDDVRVVAVAAEGDEVVGASAPFSRPGIGWPAAVVFDGCDRALGVLNPGDVRSYVCEVSHTGRQYPPSWDGSTDLVATSIIARASGLGVLDDDVEGGRPVAATGTATVAVDRADRLDVTVRAPSIPVAPGSPVPLEVTISNTGGVDPAGAALVQVWSADAPDCYRQLDPAGFRSGAPVTLTCTGRASAEGATSQQAEVRAAVLWPNEGPPDVGSVAVGTVSFTVGQASTTTASTSTTTTAPPDPPGPPPSPPATPAQPRPLDGPLPGPTEMSPATPPDPAGSLPRPAGGESSDATPGASGFESSSPMRGGVPPSSGESTESRDPGELALPAPVEVLGDQRVPDRLTGPTPGAAVDGAGSQRVLAFGVASTAQPLTSLSLVLVVAIVAALAVRPLLLQQQRSRAGQSSDCGEERT
jgi:hypothetical protein